MRTDRRTDITLIVALPNYEDTLKINKPSVRIQQCSHHHSLLILYVIMSSELIWFNDTKNYSALLSRYSLKFYFLSLPAVLLSTPLLRFKKVRFLCFLIYFRICLIFKYNYYSKCIFASANVQYFRPTRGFRTIQGINPMQVFKE